MTPDIRRDISHRVAKVSHGRSSRGSHITCYQPGRTIRQPAATLAIVVIVCALASAWTQQPGAPAQARTAAPRTPWADWVEPDFPFFSSVLDARRAGGLPGGLS